MYSQNPQSHFKRLAIMKMAKFPPEDVKWVINLYFHLEEKKRWTLFVLANVNQIGVMVHLLGLYSAADL